MGRRIVTTRQQAIAQQEVDSYFDRLVKYIPTEIVAAWVAAAGVIAGLEQGTGVALWIAFAVGTMVTFLWILRRTQRPELNPALTQAGISTVAFAAWVFALGGPFATLSWYEPAYGSLLIILFTLLAALIVPTD